MIFTGDALKVLSGWSPESVDCVVTSPPYFGLRDYGMADQIGLEGDYREFIARLVGVFAEVWRVLKPAGTLWLNLGDSYAAVAGRSFASPRQRKGLAVVPRPGVSNGLKPKDLIGIPWRVALALQDAGWYLRSDIVWEKPNCMPESVRDRPTRSHEYLFLLAKSERYFYDAAAVKEPICSSRYKQPGRNSREFIERIPVRAAYGSGNKERKREAHRLSAVGSSIPWTDNGQGRNRRTVWKVATAPFKGAHFATFPEKLVEPCILAGCPAGGVVLDPFCGAGTVGVVAERLGRHFVGVELNPAYARMARKRILAAESEPIAA